MKYKLNATDYNILNLPCLTEHVMFVSFARNRPNKERESYNFGATAN